MTESGEKQSAGDLRWSAWAADPEGITGDKLLGFVDDTLFPAFKGVEVGPRQEGRSPKAKAAQALRRRRLLVKGVFEDAYQYMKSGTLLRQVVNKIQTDIRETMRTASRDSALAALRAAGTADEIKAAWMRIAVRMDDLFITLADISPLRDIVFQLAIQRQLAPQNEDDEPATALLDRIAEEKEQLVREKKIGKPKRLLPITDDKVPFSEPDGWAWCRLGSILRHCRNGISASPNDDGIGYPMLRISVATSRRDAVVDLNDHRFSDVPPERAEPYLIEADDLLACRFNGNLQFVGRVAMIPDVIDQEFIHPHKLIKLKTIEISPRYTCYAVNAKSTRKQIHEVAATTAGNIGINGRQLQNLLIPIPPLAEQYRIVSKIEGLIRLIDQLEYHLAARQTVHYAFSTAAVHRLER